jgi:glycosyltransferase involved in cell wall biosynthesis
MRENMRASWLAILQVPFLLSAQTWRIRRRSEHIDVVNSHWMVPSGLTAAWARGRRRRFRHVLHVHAADVYLLATLPFGSRLARYVLRRTDAVLADGSHVRTALDELVGFSTGATLRPMGAWVDDFQAAVEATPNRHQAGYLVFVGRLVEKKGVTYLIEAMETIRRHHPQLGLVIIGDGPLRASLEADRRRLGLEEAIEFVGALPHDEVIRVIRRSRLAVVPSVIDAKGETEGMPTVVIEMMAAGLPVVGSDVDGIPDVIDHGRNGWLARPADPADLSATILQALESDDHGVRESALTTAASHDWAEVALAYVPYLDPDLARGGGI